MAKTDGNRDSYSKCFRQLWFLFLTKTLKVKRTCRNCEFFRVVSGFWACVNNDPDCPKEFLNLHKEKVEEGCYHWQKAKSEDSASKKWEYVEEIKCQLRDVYGFKPLKGSTKQKPLFSEGQVPDGEYPMTINGKVDRVRIEDGSISHHNFDKPTKTQ